MKEKRVQDLERNSKRKHNRSRNFQERLEAAEFAEQITSNGVSPSGGEAQPADVISRDSGVISPSDPGQEETESELEPSQTPGSLQVHDTPTLRANNNNNYLTPVKAEIVTNELDDGDSDDDEKIVAKKLGSANHQPPPYHIAATRSKHAGNFFNIHHSNLQGAQQQNNNEEEHFYENQDTMKRQQAAGNSLERKSSFLSDGTLETLESFCESETSTAPSSLQTIIRAPYVLSQPSQSAQPVNSEPELLSSASNLRKVSEQLLNTSRTRNSLSVSSPAVARGPPVSRPSSQQSNSSSPVVRPPPVTQGTAGISNSQTGREHRPNSFAGPPNTVGLPVPVASPVASSEREVVTALANNGAKFSSSKLPKLKVNSNYQESPGLLSTISQAAISDDESPPATHKPNTHKFNTAVLSKPSPPGREMEARLPNYENVEKPEMMTQGQYRAAAAQAKVATIPGEESSAYMSMGLRKHSNLSSTPLATSSPSGIPRYSSTVK